MKKIYPYIIAGLIILFSAPFVQSQDSAELIKQANNRIDDIEKKFVASISSKQMDPGVKGMLNRFITVESDSIQQVVTNESNSTAREKLLALNGHASFLDAFQYEIISNSFEVYHIRDLRNKYLSLFDLIRHDQPYDAYMSTLGPQKSKVIATAFKEYPQGPRLRVT